MRNRAVRNPPLHPLQDRLDPLTVAFVEVRDHVFKHLVQILVHKPEQLLRPDLVEARQLAPRDPRPGERVGLRAYPKQVIPGYRLHLVEREPQLLGGHGKRHLVVAARVFERGELFVELGYLLAVPHLPALVALLALELPAGLLPELRLELLPLARDLLQTLRHRRSPALSAGHQNSPPVD